MNVDAGQLVDRISAALDRINAQVEALGDGKDQEIERLNSELQDIRQKDSTSARTIAELTRRNGELASEVEMLKSQLLAASPTPEEGALAKELESMVENRQRDVDEIDSVLTELQSLLDEPNAKS